jgi:hypothetical protein
LASRLRGGSAADGTASVAGEHSGTVVVSLMAVILSGQRHW